MAETTFSKVSTYVEGYVVQSSVWDNSSLAVRKKAVNRAELILRSIMHDVFPKDKDIPVEILGEQTVWVLKLDDTIERADFGMKNVWVDGTMITISDKDNSICPLVYKLLGMSVTAKGFRRRVGAYNVAEGDYNRWGCSSYKRIIKRGDSI